MVKAIITSLFVLITTGCATTVPSNDTRNPTILISADRSGGGLNSFYSTNPNANLVSTGCPIGTANAGDLQGTYITNLQQNGMKLFFSYSDRGGIEYGFVRMAGVPTVTDAFSPTTRSVNVRVNNSPLSISATFTAPKTAEIITFTVPAGSDQITIQGYTRDFSGNITDITASGNYVRVRDISACN